MERNDSSNFVSDIINTSNPNPKAIKNPNSKSKSHEKQLASNKFAGTDKKGIDWPCFERVSYFKLFEGASLYVSFM